MQKKKFKVTPLERAWILYDVGNSAFVLMIATLVPIFFNALAEAGGVSKVNYLAYWGYASSVVTVITAVLGPILGTLADTKNFKKPIFMLCLFVGVLGCCAMGAARTWLPFLVIFIVAKIGFSGSLVFYDSMLGDVTTPERMDMVSSRGYAWGYIGSTVPFIICLALIMGGPALGVPTMLATRLSFIITGAWWLIFTLPLIRTYKQKYGRERGPEDTIGHIVGGVFSEVGHTMREIAHNKTVLVYMIAFFFYIDGVHTVISMATSYGSALGIDSTQLVLALLVTQFVAFPSAIIYGKLAGRVGTLNMILVAVVAYMGIVLFAAFFLKTAFEFWVLAIMVGLFQGGVQALSRSYFGRIIPKEKSNEYYGFFDIFGRYASVMGTFLVSVVTSLTGNPSLGVLSIGVLLVVGFMLLVRLSRMTRAAEHAA